MKRPDGPVGLALVGATATAKSALALELARRHHGVELVTADSMQVYRGMDIGTAKPSVAEQAEVRHHLIDLIDPHQEYNVARYQREARIVLADIAARGGVAILVGGTGLYVRAVIDNLELPGQYPEVAAELAAVTDAPTLHARLRVLDPVAARRMEPTNHRRIVRALEVTIGSGRPFSSFGPGLAEHTDRSVLQVGLAMPRATIDARITRRYEEQLASGFVAEAERLLRSPHGLSRTARQALGYRQLFEHLDGRLGLDEAVAAAVAATRRFARRQERWFRRDPRVCWIPVSDNPMAALPDLLRHFAPCT